MVAVKQPDELHLDCNGGTANIKPVPREATQEMTNMMEK